ncbi:MAG: RtcB family protein [Candidatus Omnitrophota bacterium]
MTQQFTGRLEKIDDQRWLIPKSYMKGMKVPGIIFSDEDMIKSIIKDNAPQQVANAAHLEGIVKAAMAMPDIHWGYGLPIGGVIATDIDNGGVITPGGVGYDINCGVRLLKTDLRERDVASRIEELIDTLYSKVPTGVGSTGNIKVNFDEEKKILIQGAKWAVDRGYGRKDDLEYCEENGAMKGADPEQVSKRALERGNDQSGTLGSGNHFLEVQVVDEIYDNDTAGIFGLEKGQVTVMIHTGSRGLGHQICGDYAGKMARSMERFNINIPDRQLSCSPVKDREGENYLSAMRCAANYAWCNRQIITHLTRGSFQKIFGQAAFEKNMTLVYDVAHNIAKIEEYAINGEKKQLCVHRKGATRAFPPGHKDIPDKYKKTGQPILIPGDMGRCSYVLAGRKGAEETFYSTCHGAGRLLSRTAAQKLTKGRAIARELAEAGITVRYTGRHTLNEEVSDAYKDVNKVVDIVEKAGLAGKIAKLRPIGVIKG